jgi:hypothetical protein
MAENEPDAERRPSRVLAHPAFLLVLTAVLTGLLVPWITNQWEERDRKVEARRVEAERELEARRAAVTRELEVKSTIVSRIGTASARFLSAMEVRLVDADSPTAPAEYRALRDSSLEIGSQLAAYFPESLPVVRWRDYTYSLRNAYLLLQQPPGPPRDRWLDQLNRYLDVGPQQYDGLCFAGTSKVFATDLRELVVALQNREEEVVRMVTRSNTVLTGRPTRDVNVPRTHYDPKQRKPCTAVLRRQGGG